MSTNYNWMDHYSDEALATVVQELRYALKQYPIPDNYSVPAEPWSRGITAELLEDFLTIPNLLVNTEDPRVAWLMNVRRSKYSEASKRCKPQKTTTPKCTYAELMQIIDKSLAEDL